MKKSFFKKKVPSIVTAKTGERCPVSGVWRAFSIPSTTAPIAVNNVMPPYRGKAVVWILMQLA